MKKKDRICRNEEFQTILQKRKFINKSGITVYYERRKEAHPRFGFAVPKKMGNAVLRNKTKRQLREMVQALGQDVIASEFDYIVMVRKSYYEQSFKENKKDLETAFKNVKIRAYS